MNIRGILFDKDGTLLDYYATWMPLNRQVAVAAANGDQALADRLMISGGFDPESGRMQPGSPLAAGSNADIAAHWHPLLGRDAPRVDDLTRTINGIFESGGAESAKPVTDLATLLTKLKGRGLKLGVATSDSEQGARQSLSPFSIIELLDFVAGYDSGHGGKPGAGMVHGFLAATGLEASEVMVVGDNHHDMEMGRSAGAGLLVGVLTGTSGHDDLAPYADYVVEDITRIERLLDQG